MLRQKRIRRHRAWETVLHRVRIPMYLRHMLRSYVRHTFIVTFILLSVILTIELSPWIPRYLSQGASIEAAMLRLARFSMFRTIDILADLWFISCFLGILWSEVDHSRQGERTMVLNSGRSPLQCLIPVILFGIPAGVVQFALDGELRPWSVMHMAVEDLGSYGPRFHRKEPSKAFWLVAGNDVVNARISYDPPMITDAVIYRRSMQSDLISIVTARQATPTDERGVWCLRDGSKWRIAAAETPRRDSDVLVVRLYPDQDSFDYAFGRFELSLDPRWLHHFDVDPKYIAQGELHSLANAPNGFYRKAPYRTEVQARYAHAFFPLLLGALASSLVLLLMPCSVRLMAVSGVALVGYMLGSVLAKVFVVLGANGDVSPLIAGWFSVCAFIALLSAIVAKEYGFWLMALAPDH